MKIGFIGAGNMANAIYKGVVTSGYLTENNIVLFDIKDDIYKNYSNETIKAKNVSELVSKVEVIFLAVKPHLIEGVLNNIHSQLTDKHLLISIAAGVDIDFIQSLVNENTKIVRVMPNTPALVLKGVNAITFNQYVTTKEKDIVFDLFNSCGYSFEIEERLQDAIPAITGSSPAYVYKFIEALADGGVRDGIPRGTAIKIAALAVEGAAKMVVESNEHPMVLKDKVTSPGGTTIEALKVLDCEGFSGTILKAMEACTKKTKSLK